MWFEALPSVVIIGVLIHSFQITSSMITNAMFGKPYQREQESVFQRQMFQRDNRVGGTPWAQTLLDNIPDD